MHSTEKSVSENTQAEVPTPPAFEINCDHAESLAYWDHAEKHNIPSDPDPTHPVSKA